MVILETYVHDIEVGTTVLEGKPEVMNETTATALVDGNNLLGPDQNKSKLPAYELTIPDTR